MENPSIQQKTQPSSSQANQTTLKPPSWLQKLMPIPLVDKLFFTQHLGLMIKSGLPLSAALKTLSGQTKNKYFEFVLRDIQTQVESGTTFSNAMAKHSKVFSELVVSMVRV